MNWNILRLLKIIRSILFLRKQKTISLKERTIFNDEIIKDCIKLNQNIMRLPFEEKDKILELNYNVADCYDLIKKNKEFHLKKLNLK